MVIDAQIIHKCQKAQCYQPMDRLTENFEKQSYSSLFFIRVRTCAFLHSSFIHSHFVHSFIHPFIHPLVYQFIYPLVH